MHNNKLQIISVPSSFPSSEAFGLRGLLHHSKGSVTEGILVGLSENVASNQSSIFHSSDTGLPGLSNVPWIVQLSIKKVSVFCVDKDWRVRLQLYILKTTCTNSEHSVFGGLEEKDFAYFSTTHIPEEQNELSTVNHRTRLTPTKRTPIYLKLLKCS